MQLGEQVGVVCDIDEVLVAFVKAAELVSNEISGLRAQ